MKRFKDFLFENAKIDQIFSPRFKEDVGPIWIVNAPRTMTSDTELGDVCFETDIRGLVLQVLGGIEDIVLVTQDKNEATRLAQQLLRSSLLHHK